MVLVIIVFLKLADLLETLATTVNWRVGQKDFAAKCASKKGL